MVPAGTVQWTVLCHLSGLIAFNMAFGNLLGPLVIWLTQRTEFPEVNRHGKEVLNFHLSWLAYYFISVPLCLVFIGIPLVLVLYVSGIVLTCIGAYKASEGELFRYPLTIRFLK
jgi:uncharacterized protein